MMGTHRRKYKLTEKKHQNVDLRQFKDLIIETVNHTIKDKNPKVFETYFSTDPLTQSEAVLLGRALSKLTELNIYGKTITTFRLFDGKMYENENSSKPIKKGENDGK